MSRDAVGLVDTNIVILLPRLTEEHLPETFLISAITLAELSVGPLLTDDPEEQAARQAQVQLAEANCEVLTLDEPAARIFARVAAELHRAGRKTRARSYDALIAATAMSWQLPLYTSNPADYAGITGLTVCEVPVP